MSDKAFFQEPPSWWRRLLHRLCPRYGRPARWKDWLRPVVFRCGPRLVVRGRHLVGVEYLCPVCAKADVKPEKWESHRARAEGRTA
jgi:hypothetical protein